MMDRIWSGNGVLERVMRLALVPLEAAYRAGVAVRGAMYDHRVLIASPAKLPVVSVGNITAGGTGKTPVSAWLAGLLLDRGMKPAILLRGYGGDESLVHARLAPAAQIVVSPDRRAGLEIARLGGADVAILDDGFQHRRAARDIDIVLLSADQWTGEVKLLPRGPFREPFAAIGRATAVFITRKAAGDDRVDRLAHAIGAVAPGQPAGILRLELGDLLAAGPHEGRMPLTELAGQRVLAIAGVGDSTAFFEQLASAGAHVRPAPYPDHHAFTPADVSRLTGAAASHDHVVCTLKDAVKLGPIWPADAPSLWYVSQSVSVERGMDAIDHLLERLTAAKDRNPTI